MSFYHNLIIEIAMSKMASLPPLLLPIRKAYFLEGRDLAYSSPKAPSAHRLVQVTLLIS